MIPDRLRELLSDCPLVHTITAFASIDSTNSWVRAHGAQGTLVTAEEQTAGRGQLNRKWTSPPGRSLLFSLVVARPKNETALTLGAPLAVAQTLNALFPDICAMVKWPNDILIGARKICGILLESIAPTADTNHIIIGIGLNISQQIADFPDELQPTATSLSIALDNATPLPPREEILAAIVRQLAANIALPAAELHARYTALCHTLGKPIRLPDATTAVAAAIDPATGALRVTLPDTTTRTLHSANAISA